MIPPEIAVLVADIQLLHTTLQTAANYFEALDLAEQYRKLDGRTRRSSLGVSIQNALAKVGAYRQAAEEEIDGDDVS